MTSFSVSVVKTHMFSHTFLVLCSPTDHEGTEDMTDISDDGNSEEEIE